MNLHDNNRARVLFAAPLDKGVPFSKMQAEIKWIKGVFMSTWERNNQIQPKEDPNGNGQVSNTNSGETQPSRSRQTAPASKNMFVKPTF